ncbi:MAG: glycosyltransferase family 4 protein [Limnochordia bacterium]|jgi:glycosyltransferase involved in cell wall biosynthesis
MIPHVIHVLPYLETGGTERHVLTLITSLSRLGLCTGEVLAPPGPFSEIMEENDITWSAFRPAQAGLIGWLLSFRRLLRERIPQASLVHVHASPDLLFLSGLAQRPRRPRVLTVHGFHGRGGPVSYRLAAVCANRYAEALISVSDSERRLLLAGGADPARLHRIYNGVADVASARITDGPEFRVAFVGRLSPVKGVDVLLSAFSLLQRSLAGSAPLLLDIMGTGPQEEELRRMAIELGIAQHVRFLGYVPDAAERLAEYDVFCLPSREDMCPLVCVEAMSQGKPVVATNVGGLPELVVPEQTGFLVPSEDAEALSAALRRLVEDPPLRARMGNAARRRFEESFTQETMARQTYRVYETAGINDA